FVPGTGALAGVEMCCARSRPGVPNRDVNASTTTVRAFMVNSRQQNGTMLYSERIYYSDGGSGRNNRICNFFVSYGFLVNLVGNRRSMHRVRGLVARRRAILHRPRRSR